MTRVIKTRIKRLITGVTPRSGHLRVAPCEASVSIADFRMDRRSGFSISPERSRRIRLLRHKGISLNLCYSVSASKHGEGSLRREDRPIDRSCDASCRACAAPEIESRLVPLRSRSCLYKLTLEDLLHSEGPRKSRWRAPRRKSGRRCLFWRVEPATSRVRKRLTDSPHVIEEGEFTPLSWISSKKIIEECIRKTLSSFDFRNVRYINRCTIAPLRR